MLLALQNLRHALRSALRSALRWAQRFAWVAFVLLALAELTVHSWIRHRVPSSSDWREAADFVGYRYRKDDLVVSAPGWSDPLLRWYLGDRLSLAAAGRSDLSAFERLWSISIGNANASEAPDSAPEVDQRFGRLRVRRWALPVKRDEEVYFDFVDNVREATVTLHHRPCMWQRSRAGRWGGLGDGPTVPDERFACDVTRPWLWVAPTVISDLELKPRYCLWTHPAGAEPIRIRYDDVPLGSQLVFYGGIEYVHERERHGGVVQVRVLVDEVERGGMVHRDGDGWKRLVVGTSRASVTRAAVTRAVAAKQGELPFARRGSVTIEVSAVNPDYRVFCWAATTRGPGELYARP